MIRKAYAGRRIRVPTGTLNNMFVPDLEQELRPDHPNQKLGIRYITQVAIESSDICRFYAGPGSLSIFRRKDILLTDCGSNSAFLRHRFGSVSGEAAERAETPVWALTVPVLDTSISPVEAFQPYLAPSRFGRSM